MAGEGRGGMGAGVPHPLADGTRVTDGAPEQVEAATDFQPCRV